MEQENNSHRKLRLNHSNALPKVIIAYDSETFRTRLESSKDEASHTFRLGVAISSEYRNGAYRNVQNYRITAPSELWALLCAKTSPNFTTWVVGHNVLFDFIVSGLPRRFETGDLVIDWPRSKRKRENNRSDDPHCVGLAVIDGPPTIIACRVAPTQGRLVILDTLNWFPMALKSIGDKLGLPKLERPDWKDDDNAWYQYCHRDCEITYRCFIKLIEWVKEQRFGMFKYTSAGQAMHAYRHRFIRHGIFTHDNQQIRQLERCGYHGGRIDVFQTGLITERIHQLDCNSLFPSVMLNGEFPYVLHKFEIRKAFSRVFPIIKWQNAMANVLLDTQEAIYPVRTDKATIYPIGKFQTTLCGAELVHAHESGAITAIRSWAEYKCKPIFHDYILELWEKRQQYKREGNLLYEQLCKAMLNSLYGKFGQREPIWVNCPINKRLLPWSKFYESNQITGDKKEYRMFGWQCQVKQERQQPIPPILREDADNFSVASLANGEIDGTFIAISAFVTSAARMRMNYLRSVAKHENVVYQAIDSLFCRQDGYNNLQLDGQLHESELGKLRQIAVADKLEIFGCNDYVIGDKIVVSGRAGPRELIEGESLRQRKFFTQELLFSGQSINTVIERDLSWERHLGCIKGIRQSNNLITPIVMELPDDYSDYDQGDAASISAASVSAKA